MTGPLEGIRVVDCSAYITGPFATMMLADQGADVVKLEPIGIGDVMRHLGTSRGGISTIFAGCNRSKRSLALDLREARGREILYALVEGADVFVQNFRPGVAERIEIGEARLDQVADRRGNREFLEAAGDRPLPVRAALEDAVLLEIADDLEGEERIAVGPIHDGRAEAAHEGVGAESLGGDAFDRVRRQR